MSDYGKIAREIIMQNVGEIRLRQICQQFGLNKEDNELLDHLWDDWRPGYTLDHIIALAEKYKDYPNITSVLQACELISKEAAQSSALRRHGKLD